MENQTELKPVELKGTKEIKLPKVDISPFVGKETKIDLVETYEGQHGYYIKVSTESLGTIEGKDGKMPICASRIFGLQEDKDGQVGWGKDTNLGIFLEKMKAKHYDDLKGMSVMTQSKTNKKTRTDFLTFN